MLIIVNGQKISIDMMLSKADLCGLVGQPEDATVTFLYKDQGGIVDDRIAAQEGMIFDVVVTNNV